MVMKKLLEKFVFLFLPLSLVMVFYTFVAFGQEFPTRSIKLIVPFSPGGVADLTWRALADPMAKVLGQPIVIENKPGGAGAIGYTMVANSKPDGYIVGHIPLGSFINNYLTTSVGYNPSKDFSFIAGVARYAESIVVKSDAPWKTWEEFVDYSKKHPNEVIVGFSGAASSNTIATKWISRKEKMQWKEVTFPGDAEGIVALLGGHINAFPGAGPQNTLVKDGRARMLLALTIEPIPDFPNIPTFKKIYGKDTMNASGLMGPKGIPEPILKKLEDSVRQGTKEAGFINTMEKMSMTAMFRDSKQFTSDVNTALISFEEFLKELNMLRKK